MYRGLYICRNLATTDTVYEHICAELGDPTFIDLNPPAFAW